MKYKIFTNANPNLYGNPIAIDINLIISFFVSENEEGNSFTNLYAGEKGHWQVLEDFETVFSLLNEDKVC